MSETPTPLTDSEAMGLIRKSLDEGLVLDRIVPNVNVPIFRRAQPDRAAPVGLAEHVMSKDCRCHPKVEYVPADRWWADGAMVNSGQAGDEHFVGDAASEDDANRIVEAHNAALDEGDGIALLPPTDFSAVPVLDRMPEGLDPERSPFTAERDNALIAASQDRYIDRVRIFNATEAQVRYAVTALDEHEPGWREKLSGR